MALARSLLTLRLLLLLTCTLTLATPAAQASLSRDEERLLARLSAPRALADLERLSDRAVTAPTGLGAGTIVSGSTEEAAAARALARSLRAVGLEVTLEEFAVRAYRYGVVTLTANGESIAAISLHATGATWGTRDTVPFAHGSDGGPVLRATLVDAGEGYEPDYARLGDVHGKVVLVRRDLRDWPPAQITEAAHHGAVAIVFYDHPGAQQEPDALRQDSLWGHDQLPTVAISRRSGEALQAQLASGAVQIALENRAEVADGLSHNVVARIRGSERPDEYVLVSAHYDRWFKGAADNTSGVAAVLEIARAFARSGLKPRRTLLFVLAGSEEAGLEDPERDWLAGSNAFVTRHPDVLRSAALAFNIDLLGWSTPSATLLSTPDLLAQQTTILHDLGLSGSISQKVPFGSSTDAWNYGVVGGAATNHLIRVPDSYFAIYHTQMDTYRPELYQNMGTDLRLITLSLWRAASVQRLPIALTAVADYVDGQLDQDASKVPEVSFSALHDALAAFRAAAATIEAVTDPARTDAVNRILMATRHALVPWLYASNDEFEQATRTALLATRVAVLTRSATATAVGDTDTATTALRELYEGRQCLRLAPAVYAFERAFWAGDGGWASRFQHRAPPPPPAFEAACLLLGQPHPDNTALSATFQSLRTHAVQEVANAVALMTAKVRLATDQLRTFQSAQPTQTRNWRRVDMVHLNPETFEKKEKSDSKTQIRRPDTVKPLMRQGA
ncbi:MAG: M20/M25/M40 family metallo-hydrolase [Pseudomonadota bacterium]